MTTTNGQRHTLPPDIQTFTIKHPDHGDAAIWTDDYYRELLGYCDAQLAECEDHITQLKAVIPQVNARHAAVFEAMCRAWNHQEEMDRLLAKWIVLQPQVAEYPHILTWWEVRKGKLTTKRHDLTHYAGYRARKAKLEADKQAKLEAQRKEEADRAAITASRVTGRSPDQQRAYMAAKEHAKAAQAAKEAAELATLEAEAQQAETNKREAQTWVNNSRGDD